MNKVAIITGGGRGIGAATSELLAARGYAVCINYLKNREAAQAVAARIEEAGGRVSFTRTCTPMVENLVGSHGWRRRFR
ncbi:SDR family NAD(P)-dependent oxidoreductase [Vreelandella aquamarina]|uniref:SDR family NAD(P)-dependent oxidoreductase n=1 Tax=Vreelandella aquamarina TaxID=77097 RepID=UPI00295EF725|nr:SDR family NAD(P)-dependent oxidoreductase [Halomonas aquamarina]